MTASTMPRRPMWPRRQRCSSLPAGVLMIVGLAAARFFRPPPPPERPPLRDDRAWSIEDAAFFLGVSESLVRKLERDGRLPALPRISTRLLFDPMLVRSFRAAGTTMVVPLKTARR